MSTSKRFVIAITNPGESPADNGRTIHALQLAREINDAGGEALVMFCGKAVTWVERFHARTEDSHPFVKNYGDVFDGLTGHMRACNMCCQRFEATAAVTAASVPIDGDGREHANLGERAVAGWQIVSF